MGHFGLIWGSGTKLLAKRNQASLGLSLPYGKFYPAESGFTSLVAEEVFVSVPLREILPS